MKDPFITEYIQSRFLLLTYMEFIQKQIRS